MAVKIRIQGFSDKLFEFAQTFIDIMLECATKDGFDSEQVIHSIEKKRVKYANSNIEVENHAMNNRILLLIPHTYHESMMENVLTEKLNNPSEIQENFCPGQFLREKIL